MSQCPAKCHAAKTFTSRSCQTCVDSKTSRCIEQGETCPVGSLSCSACDGIVSRGCSAKLYAYSNFRYGESHSAYLDGNGSPYCDPPGRRCRALPSFGTRAARDRGKTGNLVGSLVVEGSEGCVAAIKDKESNKIYIFQAGEYTGSSLREGNWPYLIPSAVELTLECYVIIYNGPGWQNPLPWLTPGTYSKEELTKMGFKGRIGAFQVKMINPNNACYFRWLNENGDKLQNKEWKGPAVVPWWGGGTPAGASVLLGN